MTSLSLGLLLTLALMTAAGPFGIDMYLPGLPAISEDLATTPAMAQLTISGFMVGMALGNLLMGALSDSTGRKRPIVYSSVAFLVASVFCALAPSIELLIAARTVQGFVGGSAMVVSRAVIPDVARGAAAARGFSAMMAITGFAPAIAPVMGSMILPSFGWRGVFWFLAAVNLAQIIIGVFILRESLPRERRSAGALRGLFPRIGRCLARPEFVGYLLASGMGFAALFSYISGSPLVLQSQLGASPGLYAVLFGSMALLLPVSNMVNMRLVGRFDQRALLRFALLADLAAGVVLLVLSQFTPPLFAVVPFLAVLSLMAGMMMPNATALAVEAVRDIGAGAGNGAMGCFQFIVAGIAAALVAVGANHLLTLGISVVGWAAVALLALAVLAPRTPRTPRTA
ncbi:multidrug effflux MFS transporter [Corynebacterium sp.]|uniref:multidrug effflux MFS transporter n=1 Tax=Corynebacterium sp. TaxID=1720 RepID=UPI002A914D6D|nr:multidrug effflux MFS transporter [Corynebacterium sp.]MDY5785338.1 multidrug effflux MFS transporter [Corynebacterium sp.]